MKIKKKYFWLSEEPAINLTPLLDVIFNLIFFFLLATTIKQPESFIEIDLPGASEVPLIEKQATPLVISVSAGDVIYLNEEKVTLEKMEVMLKEMPEQRNSIVVLRGDAETHHQRIVDVLDTCARTGFKQVKMEVKREVTE